MTAALEVMSGPCGQPSMLLVAIPVSAAAPSAVARTENGFSKAAVSPRDSRPVNSFDLFIVDLRYYRITIESIVIIQPYA